MPRCRRSFFTRPTLAVAHDLIGTILCTRHRGVVTAGRIIEVEAYHYSEPASHTFRGRTRRNASMYLEGGHCYIYFIYGMHYCMNIVTESEGVGAGILIRSLQPLTGIEVMKKRRRVAHIDMLTSGPGKICQALGIRPELQGEDLTTSRTIWLERDRQIHKLKVKRTPRIGISRARHLPWRFVLDVRTEKPGMSGDE